MKKLCYFLFVILTCITMQGNADDLKTIVTPGLLDHIIITPSTPTIVSGSTQVLTATGYDCNNNVITGLHFSWGLAGGFGTVTFTLQNDSLGQITATGLVAGNVNIIATATDPNNPSITLPGITTITVTNSPSPSGISISASPSTVASGSSTNIVIKATDSNGNAIPGLPIAITQKPGTTGGNASVTITGNNSTGIDGSLTVQATGLYTGTVIITATGTVGSSSSSNSIQLEVTLGSPASIKISSTTNPLAVTSGSDVLLIATVTDTVGNLVQGAYVLVTTQSHTGTAQVTPLIPTTTDINGDVPFIATGGAEGYVDITAMVTDSAGNPIYNASNQTITMTSVLNINNPGSPSNMVVSFDVTHVASGTTTTAFATVTDSSGNLVADGAIVSWSFTSLSNTSVDPASVTFSNPPSPTATSTTSGGVAQITVNGVNTGLVNIIATTLGNTIKGQSILNVGTNNNDITCNSKDNSCH